MGSSNDTIITNNDPSTDKNQHRIDPEDHNGKHTGHAAGIGLHGPPIEVGRAGPDRAGYRTGRGLRGEEEQGQRRRRRRRRQHHIEVLEGPGKACTASLRAVSGQQPSRGAGQRVGRGPGCPGASGQLPGRSNSPLRWHRLGAPETRPGARRRRPDIVGYNDRARDGSSGSRRVHGASEWDEAVGGDAASGWGYGCERCPSDGRRRGHARDADRGDASTALVRDHPPGLPHPPCLLPRRPAPFFLLLPTSPQPLALGRSNQLPRLLLIPFIILVAPFAINKIIPM